ncbi:hypothetical protein LP419_33470 [Massilia sp. H-1]|nr:hypothetical protein LP419_33470 [Massilia sp. H-1]
MQSTLANDPRYGPPLDADAAADALNAYRSFTEEQGTCTSQLASALREAYMNACDLHHCGECGRAPATGLPRQGRAEMRKSGQ